MILIGQLTDEEGEPLHGLNICAVVQAPDGETLPLGSDTTDTDGAFALDAGAQNQGARPPVAGQRLRFEVLDGALQPIHRAECELEIDELGVPTPVRMVLPRPAMPLVPEGPELDAVAEIRILPDNPKLSLGGRLILMAEARNADGLPVSGVPCTWQANDIHGEPIPISQAGELEGHTPGVVEITAVGAGQTGSTVVKVADPRKSPESDGATRAFAPGQDDTDRGPRWDDQNADSAVNPVNRVGLGHQPLDLVMGQLALGLRGANATEAMTVGSANFTFAAPVIDLPGRGMDLRLDLVYNARLWTRTGDRLEFDVDKGWPAPGWSLGFGRIVRLGKKGSMLVAADGTRHPYGLIRRTGDPNGNWEIEARTSDGTFIDYRHIDDRSGGLQWAQARHPDGRTVDYTARGHDYRDPATGPLLPSWGVLFPTRITDAQGNVITIAYRNNTGPEIDTITDTLGRSVTFHYNDADSQLTAVTGPGLGGTRRTLLRLDIASMTLDPAFTDLTFSTRTRTPAVVRALYYPADYSGYWFQDPGTYSVYGMATTVTRHKNMGFNGAPLTATGVITPGTVVHQRRYDYPVASTPTLTDVPTYTTMTELWEGMDTPPAITRFAVQNDSDPRRVEVTYPNGMRTVTLAYNRPPYDEPLWIWGDGLPFRQEVYDGSRLVQLTTTQWERGDYNAPRPARVETKREQSPVTVTEYDHGAYNRLLEVREFDFGGGSLLRRARIEYALDQGYVERHILRLPTVVEIHERGGTLPALRTEYAYDTQPLQDAPGVMAHLRSHDPYAPNTWVPPYDELECIDGPRNKPPRCKKIHHDGYFWSEYEPRTRFRGNLTEIRRFADPAHRQEPATEQRWYDITGNLVRTEAGRYDHTNYTYSLTTQYAYPERTTTGTAGPPTVQNITAASYDVATGLLASTTDANGRTTSLEYSPTRLRPTTVTWPTGAKTTYAYEHHPEPVTEQLYLADGFLAERRNTVLDGLGLVLQRKVLAAVSDSEPEQLKYDITENRYDALGQLRAQSMPYRTGDTPAWTEITRDALGRITRTRTPDGGETHAYYNEGTQLPDMLNDPALAALPTTRVVDAWGREQWTLHNALGQLYLAALPDPDGDGSVFAAGTSLTVYSYNALGQVVMITDRVPGASPQYRHFRYDGLGRLTHQALTERAATLNDSGEYRAAGARWTDVFAYTDGDRPAWSMDARGVRTLLDYGGDPLGRVQSITYEQPVTPPGAPSPAPPPEPASAVRYAYATTGDLTRLTQVATDDITKDYAYDTEGRLTAATLTLLEHPNNPFTLDYRYDTTHRLTNLIHPSAYGLPGSPRRMVGHHHDPAGRIQRLTVDGVPQADGIVYAAPGWPTQLTLGPDCPLPLTEINDPGPAPGLLGRQRVLRDAETLLDLSYEYTRPDRSGITGQLTRATNHRHPDRSTSYAYDATTRLVRASGGDADAPPQWTQTYCYDRYGNRTAVTATGTTPAGTPIPQDGISALDYGRERPNGRLPIVNNRITTPGYAYDEAGNLTRGQLQDGTWQNYRYDAAGRLVAIVDDAGTPWETYTYGACRRRIRTIDERAGRTLCQVWDGDSVIAEYDTTTPRVTWSHSSIYLGQRLLSTFTAAPRHKPGPAGLAEELRYHHPDRLGTRLITTPDTKDVVNLTTLPYGRLLGSRPPSGETTVFTSYQRSATTSLDYALNRYYAPGLGRFLQPDPLGRDAIHVGRPRTNNAYPYCGSDPVNYLDPTGEAEGEPWKCPEWETCIVVIGERIPPFVPPDPDENTRQDLYSRAREVDRQAGDNRAYDRLIRNSGGPRPTTELDLLFGIYLLTTLSLLTGGLFAIAGETTLASGIVAPRPTGPAPGPPRSDPNTRARSRERDPDSGTRSGWDKVGPRWLDRDGHLPRRQW
ncbi:RHS repeat domain-containing protein [Streptomyces chartreusis]|uniref:RHS repeat domain-containing protein n=1 Tax=Streptomyces chartreusis TaxID=1969 RepID=UPI0038049E9C